ncbi:MAG: outer membrane protein transport protein [Ignavibacteriae bacterium]|nr:outer membrane protein transport protein [Ignavibacteriota bacterium]
MKRLGTILLVSLLAATAFATNGTRIVGFNAKTIGRGGTTIGLFDSPMLMMTNPAGISFLSGSSIDANFSLMVPSLKFTNILNSEVEGKTNYFPMPGLAYAHQSPDAPLAWGVGVFTQGGMGADFSLKHQLFPTAQEYHSKLAVMQGGPSIAYKLTPQLSIGVSAHLVYSQLEFKMPYSLQPSIMQGIPNGVPAGMTFGALFSAPPAMGGFGYSEVTALADMSDLTGFSFGGKIGMAYNLNDDLSIGVSYTLPTSVTYKGGKASMDMTAQMNDAFGRAMQGYMAANPTATQQQAQAAVMAQFGGMGIDMTKGVVAAYDLNVTLKFPQSIGAGFSWKLAPQLRISAEAEWINWASAFDNMTLSMSNGNNVNINRMLGNSGSFEILFPMQWKDSYNVRFGGEYDLSRMFTVRAGYSYGSNPVPQETIFPVFPAIVENHLMAGASVNIAGPLSVHVAYEMALNKKQTAAAASQIAQEYNGSTSELGENLFHISLSWMLH